VSAIAAATENRSRSKWHDWFISELLWQIIPYRQQGCLQLANVGWLGRIWRASIAPHMIIQWIWWLKYQRGYF